MAVTTNCIKIQTVGQIMSDRLISAGPTDKVHTASKLMADHKISSIVIMQDNNPVGIITEGDLTRKVLANHLDANTVSLCDIMSGPLISVPDNLTLSKAVEVMREKKVKHLAVTTNGVLSGIITQTDIIRAELSFSAKNSAAKNNFLAAISHQIRTPLNAIIGLSEVLAEEKFSDEQKTHISMIHESAQHMRFLLNDIIEYTKIEAGEFETCVSECSLEHLLAVIESIMRPKVMEKGLEFGIFQKTELPAIFKTDELRLRQCLMNLINNAIDFTEKGHIYINVSACQADNKPCLRFEVEDTGVGIAEEDIEKIFENFSQPGIKSYHRRQKGTGLGLAITSRIVNILGGSIAVNSRIGCGSTFSIAVPAETLQNAEVLKSKTEQIETIKEEPPCTAAQNLKGRVLVAEDTPTNQTLIKILLEKMGLNVVLAQDGNEAVNAVSQQDFDIVLMDIQMPHMNGYDATRQLRKQGFSKPIIAVTAHAMNGDKEKCIEAGCDDYLPKPIDRNHLTEILTKYLAKASDMNEKIDSVKNQINELTQMCSPQSSPIVEPPASNETLPADQLIDWAAIVNMCDDESVIKQVVDMYRNDSPKCLQSLAESIKAANPKLIKMYAHSLKGASLQIGARRLGDIAYKLECAGRDKNMDNIPEQFNKLQDEFSKLMLFLSQPDWMELAKKAYK